mmetsp:Transcript_21109/g.63166  ORF Transcript_21109/g.63166 Transcript_21109/m.63166 type:complete len:221 (-) Transcript_21109:1480-2142(-)
MRRRKRCVARPRRAGKRQLRRLRGVDLRLVTPLARAAAALSRPCGTGCRAGGLCRCDVHRGQNLWVQPAAHTLPLLHNGRRWRHGARPLRLRTGYRGAATAGAPLLPQQRRDVRAVRPDRPDGRLVQRGRRRLLRRAAAGSSQFRGGHAAAGRGRGQPRRRRHAAASLWRESVCRQLLHREAHARRRRRPAAPASHRRRIAYRAAAGRATAAAATAAHGA